MTKKLLALLSAAVAVSLALGVTIAWGITGTTGGTVRVGTEDITSLVTDQGQISAGDAVQSVRDLADSTTPVIMDRTAGAYMEVDQTTGMLVSGATDAAAATQYSGIDLQPQPTVRPSINPNDTGVDIVTPNQARIHLTGGQDAAMIIRSTVDDATTNARQRGVSEIGVIQTMVDDTRVIVMDDAAKVVYSAQSATEAVRNGAGNTASVDTCVAADDSNGNRVVIGVPEGSLGSSGQCTGAPITINTRSNGLPQLPSLPGFGLPQLPGINQLPGLPGLNLPQLPGVPGINLPQLPGLQGVNLPQLPGLPGVNLPQLPTTQLPQLPVNLPQLPTTQLPQLPTTQLPQLPVQLPQTAPVQLPQLPVQLPQVQLPVQLPQLPVQLPQLPVQLPVQLPL